jgi:hypothetical protein
VFERILDSLVLSTFFIVYQIAVTGLKLRKRLIGGPR